MNEYSLAKVQLYLYIVSNDRVPEIDFDHFDLDQNDQKKPPEGVY